MSVGSEELAAPLTEGQLRGDLLKQISLLKGARTDSPAGELARKSAVATIENIGLCATNIAPGLHQEMVDRGYLPRDFGQISAVARVQVNAALLREGGVDQDFLRGIQKDHPYWYHLIQQELLNRLKDKIVTVRAAGISLKEELALRKEMEDFLVQIPGITVTGKTAEQIRAERQAISLEDNPPQTAVPAEGQAEPTEGRRLTFPEYRAQLQAKLSGMSWEGLRTELGALSGSPLFFPPHFFDIVGDPNASAEDQERIKRFVAQEDFGEVLGLL